MNLLQVVKHLQGIALTIPNIRSANEGSVYTIQNGNPHQKYMSFVVSQTQHRTDELFDYFGLNLFLIDRLTDELEANRLQIQSLAKDCLTNILIKFCNKFYGATYNELVFHPFTEKFTDLCAGQYVQVTLQIPRNIICEDEYTTEYLPDYTLKPLNVEITENGVYEYEPDKFDGYDKVTVTVNVPQSGYTQEDLDNAYASGETHQKSLLTDIEISHNGEYEVENGYGKVTVNVPQDSGQTIYNQTKNIEYTQNGEYVVNYDYGYTGLEGVNITVNVPQSAYTSGYTQEDLDEAYESGITSGKTYQKSLLSAITITNNGNYTSTNGYSAVTVNVDTNVWYQSGKTDGIAEQKSKLSAITITENGDYTRANGYSAVTVNVDTNAWYQSGYTDGFEDGFESGKTEGNCTLNVVIISDELDGLINLAGVQVTYSGISTTYIYTGDTISISITPGLEYQIDYLSVNGYIEPISVSGISLYNKEISVYGDYIYNGDKGKYKNDYLTFNIKSGGTIHWAGDGSFTVEYRKNKGSWNTVEKGATIYVGIGDKLEFRGDNPTYYIDYNNGNRFDENMAVYNVCGNIMSLIDSTGFTTNTTLTSANTFYELFSDCNGIVSIENLVLPATILTDNCYHSMFKDCVSLTTAPSVLPATTLTDGCYAQMFENCVSLTTAPVLPATTLANSCYGGMFYSCTSLTTAPELPATTLTNLCYDSMFYLCSNLNYIKCLATDISAGYCTLNWVAGVSLNGTFIKASGMTDWEISGNNGIPIGWTVIEE